MKKRRLNKRFNRQQALALLLAAVVAAQTALSAYTENTGSVYALEEAQSETTESISAGESDDEVVDASNFDDPDTVTLVEAPELTEEEYEEIRAEALSAAEEAEAGGDESQNASANADADTDTDADADETNTEEAGDDDAAAGSGSDSGNSDSSSDSGDSDTTAADGTDSGDTAGSSDTTAADSGDTGDTTAADSSDTAAAGSTDTAAEEIESSADGTTVKSSAAAAAEETDTDTAGSTSSEEGTEDSADSSSDSDSGDTTAEEITSPADGAAVKSSAAAAAEETDSAEETTSSAGGTTVQSSAASAAEQVSDGEDADTGTDSEAETETDAETDADTDTEDNTEEISSSADGTTIESISVSWVTADDEEDNNDSRLNLVKTSNSSFAVQMRITFELSGETDYGVGDISVTIPQTIFTYRDGTAAGTVSFSVPAAPDTSATFSYVETDDGYVLTNTKKLTAATAAMMEISIEDLVPNKLIGNGELADGETSSSGVEKYVSDPFYADVEVITSEGNVIALTSGNIDASIDTTETLKSASIKQTTFDLEYPSSWDSSLKTLLTDTDNSGDAADDYVYVEWYAWAAVSGNQSYSMRVAADASVVTNVENAADCIVLGMSASGYTSGIVLNDSASSGMSLDLTELDYKSDGTSGYYVKIYIAIPVSAVPDNSGNDDEDEYTYELNCTVVYTLVPADDGEEEKSTASAAGSIAYAPLAYEIPDGHFNVDVYGGVAHSGQNDAVSDYNYYYALDQLRAGDSAEAAFRVQSYGFFAGSTEDGKTYLTMDTQDYKTYFNYAEEADSADDVEFASIEVEKPTVYTYKQFTSSGTGYYEGEDGIEKGTVQAGSWGYAADSSAEVPDIAVYASRDGGGSYTLYATVSWDGGSAQVTYASGEKEGETVSGNTVTFYEDEVSDIYTSFTTDEDAVWYNTYPVLRVKATENIQEQVAELFENSDSPSTILRNYAYGYAYLSETAGDEADEPQTDETGSDGTEADESADEEIDYRAELIWEGYVLGSADDTLAGSSMAATITKTSAYENNTSDSEVNITYETTVYETSNQTSLADYNSAVAAGAFAAETGGTFYDLLPKGVTVDVSTVQMTSDGDLITSAQVIEDYLGSGRTLLIVTVSLTPTVSRLAASTTGAPYTGYGDSFTLSFEAVYSWESLEDWGDVITNVIAFESDNSSLGTIDGFKGEPDDPTYGSQTAAAAAVSGVEELMTDLDADRDAPAFIYASTDTDLSTINVASVTGLTKTVTTGDGSYSDGQDESDPVNVYGGSAYTYRIQVKNDYQSSRKDIVIYDLLESYTPDADSENYGDTTWKGTFEGIDVSVLEEKGVAPKVYYSTADADSLTLDDADDVDDLYLLNTEIWTEWTEDSAPADYSKVTAIAVDCSEAADGSDFELGPEESLSVSVTMRAPTLEEETWADSELTDAQLEAGGEAGTDGGAHAYNSCTITSNAKGAAEWSDDMQMTVYKSTKVGLIPFTGAAEISFVDEDDQDGLRPYSVTLELYADGEKVKSETIVLSADGTGSCDFGLLDYLNADGQEITYTLVQAAAGYLSVDEDGNPVYGEDGEPEIITKETDEGTIDGYIFSIIKTTSGGEGLLFTVTDTHVPETITVSGEKVWDDDDDAAGVRPDSVTVYLYQDGVYAEKATVTADDNWTYTFTDLDKYRDHGTEIVYTVEESSAYYEGYLAGVSAGSAEDGFTITNTYSPYGDLIITKTAENTTSAEDGKEFTFELTVTDADGDPVSDTFTYTVYGAAESTGSTDGETSADSAGNTEEGETSADSAQDEETVVRTGTISTGGTLTLEAGQYALIADIPSECTYAVEETDIPSGFTLSASSGTTAAVRAGHTYTASFTNTYAASGKVYLTASKTLTGRTLSYRQFQFTVTDEDGEVLRTTYNTSAGSVLFGAINYGVSDAGKTYTYTIAEVDGGVSGYTYDETTYKAKVTVTDNGDGTLSCETEYYDANGNKIDTTSAETTDETTGGTSGSSTETTEASDGTSGSSTETTEASDGTSGSSSETTEASDDAANDVVFNNTYKASGSISLTAYKTMTNGANIADYDGDFSFTLKDADGNTAATGTNDGSGVITFSELNFTEADAGQTYTYTASEDVPQEGDAGYDADIVYDDTTEITYTLTVTDNGDGTLSFDYTTDADPIFENGLADGTLSISKTISADTESYDANTEFIFKIVLTGEDVEDGDTYEYDLSAAEEDEGEETAAAASAAEDEASNTAESRASASASVTVEDAAVREAAAAAADTETEETETCDHTDCTVTDTGTTGTVTWTLYSCGTLHFAPTNGTSGTLGTYEEPSEVPWYTYNTLGYINTVTSEGSISAGTSLAYFFYYDPDWECDPSNLADIRGLESWDTTNVTDMSYMFYCCTALASVNALADWDTSNAASMSGIFCGCSSLADADGLSGWDTANVTDMSLLFSESGLADADALADWDTSGAEYMGNMFANCSALADITGLENWDTSSVTDMGWMFQYCSSLTDVNALSSWDTSNVTTMKYMFCGCSSLTDADGLENWDTSGVENMGSMFAYCSALENVDALAGWDTSGVTDMSGMFSSCEALADAAGLENWDTSGVEYMDDLFAYCSALADITALEGWDVSHAESMSEMFMECSALTSADLSGWNTSNVQAVSSMFSGCSKLKKLDVSGWNLNKVTSYSNALGSCSSLQWLKIGTNWKKQLWGTLPAHSAGTGKWVCIDNESYTNGYTGSELSSSWTGDMAGTWVWEYSTMTYTVNYSSGESTAAGSVSSQTVAYYADVTLQSSSYYRLGYTFTGWNTASDGSGTSYEAGETVYFASGAVAGAGETVTLYAQWEKIDTTTTVENGVITLTLYAGEKASFTLPAGTAYLVYEETEAGWSLVSSSNTSGVIEPNEESEASFVNTYDTTSASVTPTALKTLDGSGAQADAFSFTLTAVSGTDGSGNTIAAADVPMPESANGSTSLTVNNSAGGGIAFGAIEYTQAGTYTYTIAENEGTDSACTYDSTVYTMTVTVTDTDSILSASVVYSAVSGETADESGEANEAGADSEDEADEAAEDAAGSGNGSGAAEISLAAFENATNPGKLTIKAQLASDCKAALSDQEFTAVISYNGGRTTKTITLNADNNWTWTSDALNAGTTYTVTETDLPSGYSLVSITGGSAAESDGSGTITSNTTDQVVITNTYYASGSFNAEAVKVLTGRTLTGGEFTFRLLDSNENVLDTAANTASGSVIFDAVTVDTESGTGSSSTNEEGRTVYTYTYTYFIQEVEGTDTDVEYNTSTKITVTVTAVDNGNGTLTTSVRYSGEDSEDDGDDADDADDADNADENTITNTLKTGSLSISKTVENGTSVSGSASFTFTLNLTDSAGNALTDDYAYTITTGASDSSGSSDTDSSDSSGDSDTTNTADTSDDSGSSDTADTATGTVTNGSTFTLCAGQTITITGLPAGTVYTVTEAAADGYTASATDSSGNEAEGNTVTGTISANSASSISYTNTYDASGSFTPSVTKTLTGGADLADGEFTFYLLDEDGNLVSTGTNAAAEYDADADCAQASVSFSEIEYTLEDVGETYTYTLYEKKGTDSDYTYDETDWTVTVTISDNGDGTLDAAAEYSVSGTASESGTETESETESGSESGTESEAESGSGTVYTLANFTNMVTEAGLSVTKRVSGGTSATADTEFTFTITLTDENGNALSGNYTAQLTDASGNVTEKTLTFYNGILAWLTDTQGTADITLKADETLTILNLPAGTSYSAQETEMPSTAYTLTSVRLVSKDGEAAVTEDENGKTASGTVTANSLDAITFTNTYAASTTGTPGTPGDDGDDDDGGDDPDNPGGDDGNDSGGEDSSDPTEPENEDESDNGSSTDSGTEDEDNEDNSTVDSKDKDTEDNDSSSTDADGDDGVAEEETESEDSDGSETSSLTKTGDSANPLIWIVLLAAAAAAIALIGVRASKRRRGA